MSEFNQVEYTKQWDKANMKLVSAKYKKEFVEEFREACKKLDIKQSDVIRQAMIEVIEKAKK